MILNECRIGVRCAMCVRRTSLQSMSDKFHAKVTDKKSTRMKSILHVGVGGTSWLLGKMWSPYSKSNMTWCTDGAHIILDSLNGETKCYKLKRRVAQEVQVLELKTIIIYRWPDDTFYTLPCASATFPKFIFKWCWWSAIWCLCVWKKEKKKRYWGFRNSNTYFGIPVLIRWKRKIPSWKLNLWSDENVELLKHEPLNVERSVYVCSSGIYTLQLNNIQLQLRLNWSCDIRTH